MSIMPKNDNTALVKISSKSGTKSPTRPSQPTDKQRAWMSLGLSQPGGKLPLFDKQGKKVNERTVRSCLRHGLVEPWFSNPVKPNWIICKLTDLGRRSLKTKNSS